MLSEVRDDDGPDELLPAMRRRYLAASVVFASLHEPALSSVAAAVGARGSDLQGLRSRTTAANRPTAPEAPGNTRAPTDLLLASHAR